jgi:hypothetical protein
MKKVTLIVFILFFAASFVFAQNRSSADRKVWVGLNLDAGGGITGRYGSNIFGGEYAYCDSIEVSLLGGVFSGGLMLNAKVTNIISFATGLNYRWFAMGSSMYHRGDTISLEIRDHAINIPVLFQLRLTDSELPIYFETGVLWGVPFSTNAQVSNKHLGIDNRYSDFRAARDIGIVFGFGSHDNGWAFAFRFIIKTTRFDIYNAINAPSVASLTLSVPVLTIW